jgi:hypothetical protein
MEIPLECGMRNDSEAAKFVSRLDPKYGDIALIVTVFDTRLREYTPVLRRILGGTDEATVTLGRAAAYSSVDLMKGFRDGRYRCSQGNAIGRIVA